MYLGFNAPNTNMHIPCIPGRWCPGPQGTACKCRWQGQSGGNEQSFGAVAAQQRKTKTAKATEGAKRTAKAKAPKMRRLPEPMSLNTQPAFVPHVCLLPGGEARRADRPGQEFGAGGAERSPTNASFWDCFSCVLIVETRTEHI